MNLEISTIKCHNMLWQGKENCHLIIGSIFSECITKGKSLYWYWADFTGSWYKNAQNAFNQIGYKDPYLSAFTSAHLLTRAIIDYSEFEIPSRDLINEFSDIYYVTIDDFANGLEKFATLHPNEYEYLINHIFHDETIGTGSMEIRHKELYQNSFDFAFQYIVMGRQKYKRGQNK